MLLMGVHGSVGRSLRLPGLTDTRSMGRCPRKDVRMTSDAKERRPRRRFSKEFKAEVVELVRTSGQSVGGVARRMDLTETAVRDWVRQADIDAGKRDGLTTAEREELTALRKENRILRAKSVTSLSEPRLFLPGKPGEPVPVHRGLSSQEASRRSARRHRRPLAGSACGLPRRTRRAGRTGTVEGYGYANDVEV